MLTDINPKLPMRDKNVTREFYANKLGFNEYGSAEFKFISLNLKSLTLKKTMGRSILEPTMSTIYTHLYWTIKRVFTRMDNWTLNLGDKRNFLS